MSDITTNESEETPSTVGLFQAPRGESLTGVESHLLAFLSHSQEQKETSLRVINLMHNWDSFDCVRRISNPHLTDAFALANLVKTLNGVASRSVDIPQISKLQQQMTSQGRQLQEIAAQVESMQRAMRRPSVAEAREKVEARPAPLTDAHLDFLEEQIPIVAEGAFNAAYLKTLAQGQSATVARDGEMVEVAPDGTAIKKGEMPTGGNLSVGTFIAFP